MKIIVALSVLLLSTATARARVRRQLDLGALPRPLPFDLEPQVPKDQRGYQDPIHEAPTLQEEQRHYLPVQCNPVIHTEQVVEDKFVETTVTNTETVRQTAVETEYQTQLLTDMTYVTRTMKSTVKVPPVMSALTSASHVTNVRRFTETTDRVVPVSETTTILIYVTSTLGRLVYKTRYETKTVEKVAPVRTIQHEMTQINTAYSTHVRPVESVKETKYETSTSRITLQPIRHEMTSTIIQPVEQTQMSVKVLVNSQTQLVYETVSLTDYRTSTSTKVIDVTETKYVQVTETEQGPDRINYSTTMSHMPPLHPVSSTIHDTRFITATSTIIEELPCTRYQYTEPANSLVFGRRRT